jgi:lysophospholipase L1-like esterase
MLSRLCDVSFARLSQRRLAVACLAAIFLLFLMDRLCGLLVRDGDRFHALVMPPSSTIRYEFRDFQFTLSTNRLGFRGTEFPVRRVPGVKRILVLGNSFTYGWGLDFDATWPHLLEQEMNAAGMQVEIANLGRPGTSGLEMRDIAARAIELLKPDLIMISVLQGGVLTTSQAGIGDDPIQKRKKGARDLLLSGLSYALPNYVQLLQIIRERTISAKFTPASVSQREHRRTALAMIGDLHRKPELRRRFDALDPETSDRFVVGMLNVAIVWNALHDPDLFVETVKSRKMIDAGMAGMRATFSAVKAIAEENRVGVLIASMPYGAYLGGNAAQNLRRLGYNIPELLDGDQSTEDQIRQAADDEGLPFISVLEEFRTAQTVCEDDFFIPFDGHYSSAGATHYAKALSKHMMDFFLSPPGRNAARGLQDQN